ncbi:hypothetical protein PQO01_08410 [Lentisphaera marina]|uniref:hypothetical protein n=1 Tax=Lentisphaera marina TaxID=1111041 RepID=UPI002366EEE5|nr:hypothetical protein [Lentisphaera marina]MDD7984966.1 hypothetical protein [Lentisphaera marina]
MPHVYVRPSLNPVNLTPKIKEIKGPFAYLHLKRTIKEQNFDVKQRQNMRRQANALLDSIDLSDIEEQEIDNLLKESLSTRYCKKCSEELCSDACPFCE